MSEAVPGQAAGEALVEAASKPKKTKKQKRGEVASASRQSAVPLPAPAAEAAAAAAAAAADEAVVANAEDPASQADPGVTTKKKKKKKKKKRKHSEAADQAIHSAPSASEAASAEAGPSVAAAAFAATAAEASTAQHDTDALASEPAAPVKPKKRKLKHKDAQAQQAAAAAGSTHLNAASTKASAADATSEPSKHIAAAVHGSVHPGEPAPKVRKKRKSKALHTEPTAEAGTMSAEEAAAEAAGPAAAGKAPGRQSRAASPADKASISASALPSSWRENAKRQDVKKGKFTRQEKDTLKQAAVAYAQEHNLPTTDFAWLFCTRSLNSEYKGQATGAWRSISESLPHRTNKAVYACGTRMLHDRNYQVSDIFPLISCIGLHSTPLHFLACRAPAAMLLWHSAKLYQLLHFQIH